MVIEAAVVGVAGVEVAVVEVEPGPAVVVVCPGTVDVGWPPPPAGAVEDVVVPPPASRAVLNWTHSSSARNWGTATVRTGPTVASGKTVRLSPARRRVVCPLRAVTSTSPSMTVKVQTPCGVQSTMNTVPRTAATALAVWISKRSPEEVSSLTRCQLRPTCSSARTARPVLVEVSVTTLNVVLASIRVREPSK